MIKKDTAVEIRQEEGQLKLFLLTGLKEDGEPKDGEGIPIINPLDALPLLPFKTERIQWVDRNDFLVQWENAKGERAAAFKDVALIDPQTEDYDAWLVAEVIVGRPSEITKSPIGSTHWFNTIISEHSRIGEYMEGVDDPLRQAYANEWGKRLREGSRELLKWAERSKKLTNE